MDMSKKGATDTKTGIIMIGNGEPEVFAEELRAEVLYETFGEYALSEV